MKKKNKSNFCIRPFTSSLVKTNGDIRACCMIKPHLSEYDGEKYFNIKKTNIDGWWHSKYLKYIRQNFLENKQLKECSTCWKHEELNLTSHRTSSNFDHKAIFQHNYEKHLKLLRKNNLSFPESIELQITNLCNLKCQMCSGAFSSKLLIENNALGFENSKQTDYNISDLEFLKFEEVIKHDLSQISFTGGEPLLNKKVIELLIKLIENKKADSIKLHISTNGTICNNKILKIFKNFKNVQLMLSIEGIEKYNDYIRFPSRWENIKNNILKFQQPSNMYIYVNSVVQNLNILYLDKLIEYCWKNNFFLKLSKLNSPHYLDILNLPKNLLQVSYERLSKIPEKKLTHTENVTEIIKIIKKHLEDYQFDKVKYQQFVDVIKKRDNYRQINIADYMPELGEEIYK